MLRFYKKHFDTMYPDTVAYRSIDSLAQWLEHWISTPVNRVRLPLGTFFFQTMHHFLVTNFHIRKMGARRKWTS